MTETARRLAELAVGTKLAELPDEVVEYGKLVLFDSLVCGLAATRLDRSRMGQRVALRFGGRPEATVFGCEQQVATINAAYANAEMMNALDADETFFNSAHFAVIGVAAALAETERTAATGADLLRASIVAFEVNARLNLATSLMEFHGTEFRWSPLSSHGYASFGAAAACGVLAGLDATAVTNAFGLVGWTAPTAKNTGMAKRARFNSFKYAPYGAIAQTGVLAAALAEEGYEGDADILDVEPGFVRAQGYVGGDRNELLADLGQRWWITETSLKPYPSCRFTHAPIDAAREFLATSGLSPDDIEAIEVRLSPAAFHTRFFNSPLPEIADDHLAPLHGAFHVPHMVAVALLGYPPGPDWYDSAALADPRVRALASRITTAADPVLADEWRREVEGGQRVRRTRGSLTIRAGGAERTVETDFSQGDPWQDRTRPDWSFVTRKFATFCAGIVEPSRQAAIADVLRDIDQVDDVRTALTPLLAVRS